MTSNPHLGSIERHDGRTTLKFRRTFNHRPEKVWRAITESEHMRWWMPVDMIGERGTGATVKMVFWPDLVEKKGLSPDAGTATISEWTPPEVFEFVWHGSKVRFEVTATSDGCVLNLSVNIETDDIDTIADNAGGYHLWLDHLSRLLDHGASPSIAQAEQQSTNHEYRRLAETP